MEEPQNRTDTGRFAKGVSGNPGGRPKGLALYIRAKTKDGKTIGDFMLKVLSGKEPKCTVRDRIEAAKFLSDRGFGKVTQPISGDDGAPISFTLNIGDKGSAD